VGEATQRKHELIPSARPRLTRHLPPRKAPLPPALDPHGKVLAQLLVFYSPEKVRGRTCSFNITTVATLTDVPWAVALDVVMAFDAVDLCHFRAPPYGIVHIQPAHRDAVSFLEEEDLARLLALIGQAVAGQAPWQQGGGA